MSPAALVAPGTVGRRALWSLIALTVVVGVTTVVVRDDGDTVSGAGRVETDGKVLVTRADGATTTVTAHADLRAGDVIVAEQGSFTVRLVGGSSIEGHVGSGETEATRIRAGATPEVLAGDALLNAAGTVPVDVSGTHVTAVPGADSSGEVRVGRSLSVRISVYRGSAAVDSAGQQRSVPALREMDIPALGRPPAAPKPLALDKPDTWDRRFLADAIDTGRALQSLANAYSPTLRPDEGRAPAFYQRLLPDLAAGGGLDQKLLDDAPTRPQGEILVGAAIASLGRTGTFAQRWAATFAFRDEGAAWGLVALDQGVASGPLLSAVRNAVDATTFRFAAATPAPTPPALSPTTEAPPTTTPSTEVVTPTTQRPGETPTTTTEPPVVTTPTLPPLSLPPIAQAPNQQPPGSGGTTVVGGLVDTVGGLLGALLGG